MPYHTGFAGGLAVELPERVEDLRQQKHRAERLDDHVLHAVLLPEELILPVARSRHDLGARTTADSTTSIAFQNVSERA